MIDAMWMLGLAGALVASVFGVLLAVLGWMGNKLYLKVDEIAQTMHKIAGDLHERINDHDSRITALEVGYEIKHGRRAGDR